MIYRDGRTMPATHKEGCSCQPGWTFTCSLCGLEAGYCMGADDATERYLAHDGEGICNTCFERLPQRVISAAERWDRRQQTLFAGRLRGLTLLALAILLTGGVAGCFPVDDHEAPPSCHETAQALGGSDTGRYLGCDPGAHIEVHGDIAVCRCPRGSNDGGGAK